MPNGVPVATVALNAAKNAGILAAQIIGAFDTEKGKKMDQFKKDMNQEVESKIDKLREAGWENTLDKK